MSYLAVSVRPTSPPYMKEVYILGTVEISGRIEMAGTAFAITGRHVITAYHNIWEEESKTEFSSCALTKEVRKDGGAYSFVDPLYLKLVLKGKGTSENEDWAILELEPSHPNFQYYFPLCPLNKLPDLSIGSFQARSIFAPIGSFRVSSLRTMRLWVEDFSKIFQYDENTVIVDGGLYRGSCGAPYIATDGLVIGMHLASEHEGRNVSLTTRKRNRSSMEVGKTIVDVAESVTDLADVHASVKVGLVLSKITEITLFIATHNSTP